MKRFVAFVYVLFLCILGTAQEDIFLLYGGEKNDFGVSLVEKEGGNGFLILGSTRSYGLGSSDFYLLSLNSDLALTYATRIGGVHHDIPQKIYPTSNNNYVILGSVYDFKPGRLNYALTFVDGLGNLLDREVLWRSENDIAGNMIQENGNTIVVGMSSDTDSRGQTKLVKFDQEGNVILEANYGEQGVSDYGFDIIGNDQGYILLSTNYCEYTASASFISYTLPSDISVLQVDNTGEVIWEYRYEGDDFDYAYSMVEINGFIYVAMNSRSEDAQSFDCIVLKLNADGELVDRFSYGGAGFEYVYKIIVDSNYDLVLCGVSSSDVERPSFYAFKINQEGELLWERKLSADASIYAYDLIESTKGTLLFTGKYAKSKDDAQVFLVELDKNGEPISQQSNITDSGIKIFPNPTNDRLVINMGSKAIKEINIYDVSGKFISKTQNDPKNSILVFDLSEFSNGMYILDLVDENNIHYKEKISRY
jgi:hypothetical protein